MTNQEVFNKVVKFLAKQRKPAILNKGGCMLKTPEGLKCAIGCLIPDKKYSKELELVSVIEVGKTNCEPVLKAAGLNSYTQTCFAQKLQRAHDQAKRNMDKDTLFSLWLYEFTQVAKEFNLKTNVLKLFNKKELT